MYYGTCCLLDKKIGNHLHGTVTVVKAADWIKVFLKLLVTDSTVTWGCSLLLSLLCPGKCCYFTDTKEGPLLLLKLRVIPCCFFARSCVIIVTNYSP